MTFSIQFPYPNKCVTDSGIGPPRLHVPFIRACSGIRLIGSFITTESKRVFQSMKKGR